MANQTSSVDTTVRISFSLLQGVFLGVMYPLISYYFPTYLQGYPLIIFLFVLPWLAFVSSMGINTLLQFIQCQKINMGKVAIASTITPAFSAFFGIIIYWFPFFRKPVEDLVPMDSTSPRDMWGFLFYLFWAGMYGQAVASGLLTSC